MSIFLQRYLFEDVLAERVDFVAFHFLAHRLKMVEWAIINAGICSCIITCACSYSATRLA
ncbi:Uncharacterised protein [Serratia plymuthica]|uniref:Uncharacterized protein n=1 Tax=Serratia plymuthica TaxID=82996 RepID=A0A2X4UZN2_SERPL|nr:Uncharacterised protein [Serratia plymuthica]